MEDSVSASDANRRFSQLLRTLKKGQSVIVTSRGRPVAKITPIVADKPAPAAARTFSPGSELSER